MGRHRQGDRGPSGSLTGDGLRWWWRGFDKWRRRTKVFWSYRQSLGGPAVSTAYQAHSVAGRRFDLRHTGAMRVAGHTSETLYTFDGVTVPLRAGPPELCWRTAVDLLGASFNSTYAHGLGDLHVGSYREVNEDGGLEPAQHVALWTDGEVALWTETGSRGREWLVDLLGALGPRRRSGSVVATGADPAAFDVVDEDVLVTVPAVGAIALYPTRRWRLAGGGGGLPTPAGELYRGGPRQTHVELRGGRQRSVSRLFLRSPSAVAALDLVEATDTAAIEFMRGFRRVSAD